AYREQRDRTARLGLSDERVAEALRVLDERGGRLLLTALAHRLGLSPRRAGQLLAALQSRLNLEGFAVISLDPVAETVHFDRPLLERQFRAEEGTADGGAR
ncbi:MAG TPA: hypothetical protein VG477_02585, partial [Thermoanaerobaculia bacterium]|nr:hypothetical protein [Thermoanaerobaculia bacterium]